MNKKEGMKYQRIGAGMRAEEIMNTIKNLIPEDRDAAIWYVLRGVFLSKASTQEQCEMIRNLRTSLNGTLAVYFNMSGVDKRGERLLQHAIAVNKNDLVLAILEEPGIAVSFESSELGATPLLLAIMNGLSLTVIEKLITKFSINRENSQRTKPEDVARTLGNIEVLELLAKKKLELDSSDSRWFGRKRAEQSNAPEVVNPPHSLG